MFVHFSARLMSRLASPNRAHAVCFTRFLCPHLMMTSSLNIRDPNDLSALFLFCSPIFYVLLILFRIWNSSVEIDNFFDTLLSHLLHLAFSGEGES